MEDPNLHAIVDMGSNGIRFSITTLHPPTTRILPTLYQDRASISLYDAQYPSNTSARQPIPPSTISSVISSLKRFQQTCADFGVPPSNVQIVATEATRTAPNSAEFIAQVKDATGRSVRLLPKEEEGRIGAMGVASSFSDVRGLVMDLGGGSTQITWMVTREGEVRVSEEGSVSFPYGAAALMRRLKGAEERKGGKEALREEMIGEFREAYKKLQVPREVFDEEDGKTTLFLTGGGFRGWGYVLMDQHPVNPYPIPIINGFQVNKETFMNVADVQERVQDSDSDVFRVSERRAEQNPAVAFLVQIISEALPDIRDIRFCQGGVREGVLFNTLNPSIRAQKPLTTATAPYAPPAQKEIHRLLRSAIPERSAKRRKHIDKKKAYGDFNIAYVSTFPTEDLLNSVAHTMYYHRTLTKETRAAAALRSTTTGILAEVHGASHENRAALALILCERWGGEISPTDSDFLERLEKLAGHEVTWWCRYIGRVAALIGDRYPAGVVRDDDSRKMQIKAEIVGGEDLLDLSMTDNPTDYERTDKVRKKIEKLGKKKNWSGGKEGYGIKIELKREQ